MRRYLSELSHLERSILLKYVVFKVLIVLLILSYYMYVSSLIVGDVWGIFFRIVVIIRDVILLVLVLMIIVFVIVGLYAVGNYSQSLAFSISTQFVSTIFKIDAGRTSNILYGAFGIEYSEIIVGVIMVALVASVFFNLSFIVRGSVAHFMWAVALILLSLIGLETVGFTRMKIYSWPPHTLSEVIFNSIVLFAAFTFFIMEVGGNLAYASLVLDRYRLKISRTRKVIESLFFGRVTSGAPKTSTYPEAGGLRLSPLAETLLRGYSGIYALEETTEELSGKVLGFVKAEERRNKEVVRSLLGMKAEPHFSRMILSIVVSLFLKLPLCVLMTLLTLMLAESFGIIYPNVVEVQSPSFIVLVFILVVVVFYYVGVIITKSKRLV